MADNKEDKPLFLKLVEGGSDETNKEKGTTNREERNNERRTPRDKDKSRERNEKNFTPQKDRKAREEGSERNSRRERPSFSKGDKRESSERNFDRKDSFGKLEKKWGDKGQKRFGDDHDQRGEGRKFGDKKFDSRRDRNDRGDRNFSRRESDRNESRSGRDWNDRKDSRFDDNKSSERRSRRQDTRREGNWGEQTPSPRRIQRDSPIHQVKKTTATRNEVFDRFMEFHLGKENEKFDPETVRPRPTIDEKPLSAAKKALREELSTSDEGGMRLNKYISKSGLCSRRKAAEMVKAGEISVNGKPELEPGYQVQDGDVITYQGQPLEPQEEMVYLLLNKPKGYITTLDDENNRKTVMDLVADKTEMRIYPVGRLDKNTTGLLLITNDGQLATKLSHPSSNVLKVYHVVLDKEVSEQHLEEIRNGLLLEDGVAEVDGVAHVEGKPLNEVGIELHIGKNRIVRRIFEHLGYMVEKLDRTYYAGLTKKDLPRGWSRHLDKREIIMLKHFVGG